MGHPYGVLPELEQSGIDSVREKGLGRFAKLSDEVLVSILGLLPPKDLAVTSTTSRAMYCFCNHDELWKAAVFEELKDDWDYVSSWQETYLHGAVPVYQSNTKRPHSRAAGLRSDLLYQSWLCSIVEIDPYWLETENVDRRSGLSVADFKSEYEHPNRPVILTDQATTWPALKKWDREYLQTLFKDRTVLVGDAPMTFERYCRYADAQHDELPLYLFDKGFADACPALTADYSVPPHFTEDLFSVLGDKRPDYRWMIIGPVKSGSTFHVDPNQTCAWNAVVRGSKKWLLYPPACPPPGVRPSEDNVDVAAPVSLMEWFLKFYSVRDAAGVRPFECTVQAGEVLFVPRGWWHAALNLENDTIAVTQNYVSSANLRQVLKFLETRNPDLVSGLESEEERKTLYDRFLGALKEKVPGVLEKLEQEEEKRRRQAEAESKLSSLFKLPIEVALNNKPSGSTVAANGTANDDAQQTKAAPSGFAFKFSF